MIRILKLLTLVLCCSFFRVSAQSKTEKIKTFKFGKVNMEEFDTKAKGADTAAAAIKLFDIGKGSFQISPKTGEFVYIFERHVRYKVVNKAGYDLADFEITLSNTADKSSEEKLQSMRGATYNLEDGKIVVSKMSSEAKFSNRVDKTHIEKKFTLPNVKEGSIIEYNYSTASDFTYSLDDWYFQGGYPTNYSAFTLTLPEYFRYKISAGGYEVINQLPAVDVPETYSFPSGTGPSRILTATASRSSYYAEDVPAIKDENYITTIEDYVSKIGFELTSVTVPGSVYRDYSSTWPKIVDKLADHENFGKFIGRDNFDKGLISSIIKDQKDSLAKMSLIFDYVKTNIKWDDKYGIYSSQNSQRAVLEKKTGNAADINLSLLGLLRSAGIDCDPVLLSVRKYGAHPGYPLLTKFNNVVVQAFVGNHQYLLDATDDNNLEDLMSYQNLSHQGLKLDLREKTASWVSLESNIISRSNIMYNIVLGEDNKFTGNIYITSDNYNGLGRRRAYTMAVNEADFVKSYKTGKPGLEINSYKVEHLKEPHEALVESLGITIEDNVEDAGELLYFAPLFYERTKENPFTLEERKFPVDFAHPFEENYRTVIEFPANYKLDKLPKSEAFSLPEQAGGFTITYTSEGNKIAIKSRITIAKSIYSAEEYFYLKELFKNIVRKQAEQIVFKKS